MPSKVSHRASPLRVAQLIESDGPGGAESVVLSLTDGLRERGVHVLPMIFAGGEGWLTDRLRTAGHEVFSPSISRTRQVDLSFLWRFTRWIRDQRIDVLHAHELMMSFYAGAAGMLTGTPHVITMHGGMYYASASHRRRALAWSARRAQAVVGVAESTCEQLASSLGVHRSAISLVPNGVARRPGNREAGRRALQIEPEVRLLLAVGNLYPVKGHRTLVAAATLLQEDASLPAWRIAIAGRGDEEEPLRRQIAEAGLEGRVHLLGLRSDIPDLLAASDGWVMPSLSEGLPMALLEAMMAGLPTVCSAVGGIPDLIEHGQSGWLVEPQDAPSLRDALARLLRNPEFAAEVGRRGQSIAVQRYGVESMVDRYLDLYER